MLRPRIIPCLLLQRGGLVKTRQFDAPKYVGDPINAVRIFNEKQADELMVLDIDASANKRPPDLRLIENLAGECRMPLCYGGGVDSVATALRIFELGVEKIALSCAAVERPDLVTSLAERVGSQSVVVVVDVKRTRRGYRVFVLNGRRETEWDPAAFARKMQDLGAGEIVINSIDLDGMMEGYDLDLLRSVRANITIPLTALGGAGKLSDVSRLLEEFGLVGAAAGSLFVFKGVFRAVLINYPNPAEKLRLLPTAFHAPTVPSPDPCKQNSPAPY